MADDKKQEALNFEVRRSLNDAYSFVLGQQNVETFAALTPEECFDQEIERISGADTSTRPNELHRIDRLENGLLDTIAKVKALPPEVFLEPNETTDVNTSPEPPQED
jgi:hypothetical protein